MQYQRRALEGIVRHARNAKPDMDIVLMAFADEMKLADYAAGKVPVEVQVHRDIAKHYRLPFINLSEEVFRRIDAKEFTWKDDFVDLHPSPFGHRLYFRTIRRMFEMTSPRRPPVRLGVVKMPEPIDPSNYSKGDYVSVRQANIKNGFSDRPVVEAIGRSQNAKGIRGRANACQ